MNCKNQYLLLNQKLKLVTDYLCYRKVTEFDQNSTPVSVGPIRQNKENSVHSCFAENKSFYLCR